MTYKTLEKTHRHETKESVVVCDKCGHEFNPDDSSLKLRQKLHDIDHTTFDKTNTGDHVRGRYLMDEGYTGYFDGVVVKTGKMTILVEHKDESRSWYSIKSLRDGNDWYM